MRKWWIQKAEQDVLLKPFFAATSEREANLCFDRLWTDVLQKEAAKILSAKQLAAEDKEDLVADTGSRLAEHLHQRREQNNCALPDICAYTRAIATNLFVDFLRGQKREWRRLRQYAVAAIVEHAAFVHWNDKGLVGLKIWQQKLPGVSGAGQQFLAGNYADFAAKALHSQTPQEVAGNKWFTLHVLMERVLLWVEMPLPLNQLVYHLAGLLQIDASGPISIEERLEASGVELPDPREPIEEALTSMVSLNLLARFGRFVVEDNLNLCERGGVTLRHSAEELLDQLHILITELASGLGYAPSNRERFEYFVTEIWRELPLPTDDDIAAALEVKDTPTTRRRTLISNGRSTALTRKWPAWLRRNGLANDIEALGESKIVVSTPSDVRTAEKSRLADRASL